MSELFSLRDGMSVAVRDLFARYDKALASGAVDDKEASDGGEEEEKEVEADTARG